MSELHPTDHTRRSYYRFWMGQQISAAGSSVVAFILIWWITLTTESALYLALASALEFGPMMLIQFVSGYVTDYMDRKWLLGVVDFLQALVTMILVYLFSIHQAPILAVLIILGLRGLFDGLHAPAVGAIIPTMIPQEDLQRVNSLSSTARSVINLISPPLAAFLLVTVDNMAVLLMIDAVTFGIAIIPLLSIQIPAVTHQKAESLTSKLGGGISFLRSSQGLIPLLIIFAAFNFFITPISMLTPLIVSSSEGFNRGEVVFALAMVISSLGFLATSLFLTRFNIDLPNPHGVLLGFIITISGLILLGYGVFTLNLWLFLTGQFVSSMGLPIVNVYSSMIWQTHVPMQLQGRVISVRMLLVTASLPIVMILTGIIAEVISFGILFLGSALAFATMVTLVWFLTSFSSLDQVNQVSRTRQDSVAVSN